MNNYISRLNNYISRLWSIRLFRSGATLSDMWVSFQFVLLLVFIVIIFLIPYVFFILEILEIIFNPYQKFQYLLIIPVVCLCIRSSYVTYTYLSHFNRSHFKTKISDLNAISRTNRTLRRQHTMQYTISLKLELQKHKNLIFAVWFLVLSWYIITFIFAIAGAIEDTFGLVEDVSMTSYLTGISIEHINILLWLTAFYMFVMWFISGMWFAFGDVFPSMRRLWIIFFWIGILIFLFAFAITFII